MNALRRVSIKHRLTLLISVAALGLFTLLALSLMQGRESQVSGLTFQHLW